MVGAVAVVWPIVRVAPIVILAIVVVSVIGLPIIVASVVGLAVVTRFSHSIHFNTDCMGLLKKWNSGKWYLRNLQKRTLSKRV